jgi:hypothetical protein
MNIHEEYQMKCRKIKIENIVKQEALVTEKIMKLEATLAALVENRQRLEEIGLKVLKTERTKDSKEVGGIGQALEETIGRIKF